MSTFNDEFSSYKNIIDDRLESIYLHGPELLKGPIQHVITGGKRLRPILCMMTAKSLNSKHDALNPSISIELLHIFSLIHDDIMDNDILRHGKKTIHSMWNVPVAILAGDAVLALAFNALNKVDNSIKELFNSALIAVCEGQALDLEYESYKVITIEDYMSMIKLKTSHMIGLSSQLGAMVSNADKSTILQMKKFGMLLGDAFQIQDDLLEVTSNMKTMGKKLNSDFVLNKKTFLSIKAHEMMPDEIDDILSSFHNDFEKMIFEYKKSLINNGIVDIAQKNIDNLLSGAKSCLKNVKLSDNNLFEFIKLIENRKC